MIRQVSTERILQMMNRLEAPHGVLSRFFRAFEWPRVRGGAGMRWGAAV